MPYFALPPVDGAPFVREGLVYPVFLVLPMGWSHAPFICQTMHLEILKRKHFSMHDYMYVCRASDRAINRVRHGVYLDDGWSLSPVRLRKEAELRFRAALAALEEAGLSTKEAKNVPPTVYPVVLLGMLFEGKLCKFGPDPKSLAGLIEDTRVLVNRKIAVSLEAVERLLGRWVWFLIPTRLALSVLNHLYVFVKTLRESADIPLAHMGEPEL